MGISKKMSVSSSIDGVVRICTGMFFFLFVSVSRIIAQVSDEPSLGNVKKTGAAVTEEVKKMKEKAAHDEFMSYVYMVVGFSIVIAIAWITTVKARKRTQAENEEKLRMIQHNLAHKKNHVGHGHGHPVHKVRR